MLKEDDWTRLNAAPFTTPSAAPVAAMGDAL